MASVKLSLVFFSIVGLGRYLFVEDRCAVRLDRSWLNDFAATCRPKGREGRHELVHYRMLIADIAEASWLLSKPAGIILVWTTAGAPFMTTAAFVGASTTVGRLTAIADWSSLAGNGLNVVILLYRCLFLARKGSDEQHRLLNLLMPVNPRSQCSGSGFHLPCLQRLALLAG